MPSPYLHTGLLLELPTPEDESKFWADKRTLKSYTWWDAYLCLSSLIGQFVTWRVLGPLLRDRSALPYVWHWHFEMIFTILSCVAVLVAIWRCPETYRRWRHRAAFGNRMLRMSFALAATWQRSPALHALVGPVLGRLPRYTSSMDLDTALHNVTRILTLTSLTSLAHSNWVFAAKWWLLVQLASHALTIFGLQWHQACSMAGDVTSATLLQPSCEAMSQLHQLLFRPWLGSLYDAWSRGSNPCADSASSARTLIFFVQILHSVWLPAAGFLRLEWRLKQAWVARVYRRQLVFGPPWCSKLLWPDVSPGGVDSHRPAEPDHIVTRMLRLLLLLVGSMGLLWVLTVELQPLLPHEKCFTCADAGTCQPLSTSGTGFRAVPGWFVVLVLMGEMFYMLCVHMLVTCAA